MTEASYFAARAKNPPLTADEQMAAREAASRRCREIWGDMMLGDACIGIHAALTGAAFGISDDQLIEQCDVLRARLAAWTDSSGGEGRAFDEAMRTLVAVTASEMTTEMVRRGLTGATVPRS